MAQGTSTDEPSAGEPASVLFEARQRDPEDPVPILTRPGLLLPEDD